MCPGLQLLAPQSIYTEHHIQNGSLMSSTALLNNLMIDGFAHASGILSDSDIQSLQEQCARLLSDPGSPWTDFPPEEYQSKWQPRLFRQQGRSTNFLDFLGMSTPIDKILNGLLERQVIRDVLRGTLGEGFWLAYAQIRRAEINSCHLRVHTDTPDGLVLSILVSDVSSKHGTTAFLRGSHHWPRIINNFPLLTPFFPLWRTEPAVGTAGDIYFFYTETWHGSTSAVESESTAILLTFLSARDASDTRGPPNGQFNIVGTGLNGVIWNADRSRREPALEAYDSTVYPAAKPVVQWNGFWRFLMIAAVFSGFGLQVWRRARSFGRKIGVRIRNGIPVRKP